MVNHEGQAASGDPLYDSVRQAARRLTIGVPLLHRLIDSAVIPTQSFNGRRKIAKLVVGQLLASAYEIWPPERRPHYSVEELRRLGGIRVEEVASMLGLGRTSGYEAARKRQIPARKLPDSDRWIIPEDVVRQMEASDIGNLPPAIGEDRSRPGSQRSEVDDPATDGEEPTRTSMREAESTTGTANTGNAVGHNE
jgi:hypothetical protein